MGLKKKEIDPEGLEKREGSIKPSSEGHNSPVLEIEIVALAHRVQKVEAPLIWLLHGSQTRHKSAKRR